MSTQSISITQAIEWGTKTLKESGIETPHLDAEVLLAHCLQVERVKLYVFHNRSLESNAWKHYQSYIKRRLAKEPVAYITGCKEFYSLSFSVTPAVLIPRPETEILFEEALSTLRKAQHASDRIWILELGTGSGVISVCLAHELLNCTVIATDISDDAIEIAKSNARKHQVEGNIHFLIARYLSALGTHIPLFNCIISNPPYLSLSEWECAQSEIRDYEPSHALIGGRDGMDFYRMLMPHLGSVLAPEGWIMLELGIEQAETVAEIIASTGLFPRIELKHDLSGIPRVIKAQKGNQK